MKITFFIVSLVALLSTPATPAAAKDKKTSLQEAKITVTEQGFEPERVTLKAGQPVRLTVTRTTDATCAKEIVLKELGIRRKLPLNAPQVIEISTQQIAAAKKLTFLCGMDMLSGEIVFE